MEQTTTKKNFVMFWFLFIIAYLVICTSAALFAVRKKEDTQASIKRIRSQKIEELLRENKLKGFATSQSDDKYNESLYNQGGGINPGFKKMVAVQATQTEEPSARAYEKQLAEYRLQLAEERKRQLEQKRIHEEAEAKQRAIIEQDMQEYKKQQELQQQELQKIQNVNLNGSVGPSKTFTAPKTQGVKTPKKAPTQQKTQIGTLKTSKLGESSFQK